MAHASLGGEEGILTARATEAGLVYTGSCLIYWITIDPSAATWAIEISDGVASGTTKWSSGGALDVSFHYNFGKPMKMETGIYAEAVTNITAATIGYAKIMD